MSHPSQAKTTFKRPGFLERFAKRDLYDKCEPYAKNIKILLQMGIGGVIAILLIVELFLYLVHPIPIRMFTEQILGIVGVALVFSTVFELAYTLFTDDLDEAVNPVITGLAATILLIISRISTITFDIAIGVAILVLALVVLFMLRYFFIDEKGLIRFQRGSVKYNQQSSAPASASTVVSSQPSEGKETHKVATPPSQRTETKVFGMGWPSTG